MKKTTFTLLFIASMFLSLTVRSQCTICSTTNTISTPGFINLDSIPCIVQNQAYDYAIPVHMYSSFYVAGLGITVNVDSITFVDIDSLPCGMCWSTSKTSNTFAANENGCIRISGTTNDSAVQYNLGIALTAYYTEGGIPGSTPVPPATVRQSGIQLILRVITPSGACNPVDTSSSIHNILSSISCITGVNDLQGFISLFDVSPNPINSGAVVSFAAIQSGVYTLKLTDLSGRTLRTQQLQAHTGINTTGLQRQSLPSGIYFISIGNEQGMITRKLIVTD